MTTCVYHEQQRRVCAQSAEAWCALLPPEVRWRVVVGALIETYDGGQVLHDPEYCLDHAALVCVRRNARWQAGSLAPGRSAYRRPYLRRVLRRPPPPRCAVCAERLAVEDLEHPPCPGVGVLCADCRRAAAQVEQEDANAVALKPPPPRRQAGDRTRVRRRGRR